MKHIIFGVACGVIVILSVINCLRFHKMQTYTTEFETALSDTCDQVSIALTNGEFQNNSELKTYFRECLNNNLPDHSDDPNYHITYQFVGVDSSIGLLSVNVTEKYTDIGGSAYSITDNRTIILEEEMPPKYYSLTYLLPEDVSSKYKLPSLYHAYQIEEAQSCSAPSNPSIGSLTFKCWQDTDSGKNYQQSEINMQLCTADKTFVAVFE